VRDRAQGGRRRREEGGEKWKKEKKKKKRRKREKKEKERKREKERDAPAPIAASGRTWPTGSRAARDEMAARKKREGTGGGKRKDGTTIEIGCQDGGNSGRGLSLTMK